VMMFAKESTATFNEGLGSIGSWVHRGGRHADVERSYSGRRCQTTRFAPYARWNWFCRRLADGRLVVALSRQRKAHYFRALAEALQCEIAVVNHSRNIGSSKA